MEWYAPGTNFCPTVVAPGNVSKRRKRMRPALRLSRKDTVARLVTLKDAVPFTNIAFPAVYILPRYSLISLIFVIYRKPIIFINIVIIIITLTAYKRNEGYGGKWQKFSKDKGRRYGKGASSQYG